MSRVPDSICMLGHGPAVADFALRRILRSKECDGSVIILDHQGRGAAILHESNAGNLPRRSLHWFDMADRVRPVSLFHLRHSEHFASVAGRLLANLRNILPSRIADSTLQWGVQAALQLSKEGTVGLGAMLKTASDPAARRWFLDTQTDPEDLGRLLQLLHWALRFPAAYSASEGNNRADLAQSLKVPSTTWIEMPIEHFERCEHRIVALLVEAALEDVLHGISAEKDPFGKPKPMPKILHLFPPYPVSLNGTGWVAGTAKIARHIAVHAFDPRRPLNTAASAWATSAEQVWVVGGSRNLSSEIHGKWLIPEEIERIRSMDRRCAYIRGNTGSMGVVTRIAGSAVTLPESHRIRTRAAAKRRPIPLRQMGSASGVSLRGVIPGENLYGTLSTRESLRNGWFKVHATARKSSHGIDNVTTVMFEEKLEEELGRLSDDLRSRTYRCRPLKSMVIPKPDGGQRRLGIACIRDRVVMSACLLLLDPVFDPTFSHFSFGFRSHRNAHQALAVTRSFIGTGATWAVTADIRKCFDCIDHDVLMTFVAKIIGDPAVLDLIRHWLIIDVLDFGDIIPTEVGVPQGEAMSPLLANIYLDPLDKHFERLGLHFVRYADDITILTRSEEEAKKALGSLADFLRNPLHLELKPAKTGYEPVSKGFDILGFRLSQDGPEIQRSKMDRVVESLRDLMKILGDPKSTLQARSTAVFRFNAVVRGFRNYFLLPRERKLSEQMNYLDGRMEQMAYNYLSTAIRDDPAWICRERFSAPNGNDGTDDETEQQVQQVVGGYKFFSSKTSPDGWMVKSGLSESPDRPDERKAVLIDGDKPEDTTEVRQAETVVENAGRLYVLAHGSYLTMEGEDLVVKRRNVLIYRRNIDNLGLLFLQGMAMNISVGLQVKLAEMDIPVVFAPPVGTPAAILNPIRTPRSFLRALQVLRRDDVDVMKTGLDMLSAKVGNQAAVLRYFAKYRKNANALLGLSLVEAADEIKILSAQINGLDPSDASVRTAGMGYEGRAAAVYWKHIAKLVSGELSFEGRVTRKATDVVNQSLNYVYGMLYGEVWRAIVKVGLDPYFGIVHGSERNQGGLVFDLIEEFRAPFADRIVFGMFGRGFIPEIGGHGFLKTRSKRRLAYGFAKRWSKKISWRSRELSPAGILEKQAAAFSMLMKREGRYHPFRMRW